MSSSLNFVLSSDNFSLRCVIFCVSSVFIFRFFSTSIFADSIFSFAVVEILCLCSSHTSCLQTGQDFSWVTSVINLSSRLMSISKMAFLFSFSRISFSVSVICWVVVSIFDFVSTFSSLFVLRDFVYLISCDREVIVCSISWASFADSIRSFSFCVFWFSRVESSDFRM